MTRFYSLKIWLIAFKSRLYQFLSVGGYAREILLRGCLLLPLIGILSINSTAQTKYHVKADGGADTDDGLTWNTAFATLQKAIESTTAGDSIWVAKGKYIPTKDKDGSATPTDDRYKTFYIDKNIKLYGGFAGTEMALSERMLGQDTTFLDGALSATLSAYHVVHIDGTMTPITNEMVLDGFAIRNGKADGPFIPESTGGAIFNDGYEGECSPSIVNALFFNNSADTGGGAIFNYGDSGISSPSIVNAVFYNNSATGSGGAIYNFPSSTGTSSPSIVNAVFYNNSAIIGGAICNIGMHSGTSSPNIVNAIFYNNSASLQGGAIYNNGSSGGTSIPTIKNGIFWSNKQQNKIDIVGADIFNIDAAPTISHSLTQKNSTYSSGEGIINNQDPQFVDVDNGNFHLIAGSPAIDKGDNTAISEGINTDLDGNIRIQNETVDLGAYENIPVPCPTDLASFTILAVGVTNSICEDRARIPSGGQLTAPEITCPEGATLQYSTDEMHWSAILPLYDQENEKTIYTRCNCNSDNTVSSSTASATTTPGACPSYPFNQYCWEDLSDTWTGFNNLGTDAKGNSYFAAYAEDNSPKLYKDDGTTIEDLTPPGGIWTSFAGLGTDRKGTIYFRISMESNDRKLYSYDGFTMKDLTPAGGPWSRFDQIFEDSQGNISFSVYNNATDKKLYKSDGITMEDLTPAGGPWSDIDTLGEDGYGNPYFSIYTEYANRKLYKSVGLTIEDITPGGGPWWIGRSAKDSQGNIYFTMEVGSQGVRLYKSDGFTLVNVTLVGGPWDVIANTIKDRQGNLYFYIYAEFDDAKLYKNDGTTIEDITPAGGPWRGINDRGQDSQGNIYFSTYDNATPNDQKLYKYDGTTMEDMTPAGGPWSAILNRGQDSQGNSYFSVYVESNDQKLYKSDGTTIEDLTPTGGPWTEIEDIIADGQGNIYFSIYAEFSDRKLFKSDGTTLEDLTPVGGPWNEIRKIAQDGNGNIYFTIPVEYYDQRLYRSNGTTMEDITPEGGPWESIGSVRKYRNNTSVFGEVTGQPIQGNNYFVIYTDYSDRKLYKSNSTMMEDITPSGGTWSDIYYLSDNDGKGNIYIRTAGGLDGEKFFYNYPGPCPNQLTAASLLANSVELEWQDNCETANEWEIEYDTAGFTRGTGTRTTVTEKPYFIEKLLPNTDYEFYVRANCGGSEGTSGWSLAQGFNTTAKISANNASALEGDEGEQNLVFTLTLSAISDKTLAVEYFTEDFTATAGVDYEAIPKTILNFNPGEFTKTVEVPILGDLIPEENEFFYLVIKQVQPEVLASAFAPTGTPLLEDGVALGYILDDDFTEANQDLDSSFVCGTQVALNGTPVEGTTIGTWTVLHSTEGAGNFADENSPKSIYSGNTGSRDSLLWQLSANGIITSQDTMIVEFSPDSDEDGVQDCVDACLDGNDGLDSDGDGAPDECDCNPNDAEDSFVVVDAVGDETLFQSSNRLLSNAVIGTGLDVTFLAGQSIALTSGFHAEVGSNFLAKLGPCQNPISKIFQEEEAPRETAASSRTSTKFAAETLDKRPINLNVQPNPIRQDAKIGIELPTNTTVSLTLYDLNGRLLKTLLRTTEQAAGTHHFSLQVGYLPSGMYLLQLRSDTDVITKKIIVQR